MINEKEIFFREDERLKSSREELGKENAGRGNRVNKMFCFDTRSTMKEQVVQTSSPCSVRPPSSCDQRSAAFGGTERKGCVLEGRCHVLRLR